MILSGQKLINEVNRQGCAVRKRLWIASPFLGEPDVLFRLFGRAWYNKEKHIDVRFITDISNDGWLNHEAFEMLRRNAKTLKGLHAKIFIMDDAAIVGSANLTRTAFEKRYEMCVSVAGRLAEDVANQFQSWWGEASVIGGSWSPRRLSTVSNCDEPQGHRLSIKAKLPDIPSEYNCEIKRLDDAGDDWWVCSVEEAKSMIASGTQIKYRCVECKGVIRLHKAWESGEVRAHPEHRRRQTGCSRSDAFNGKQRQADDVVL